MERERESGWIESTVGERSRDLSLGDEEGGWGKKERKRKKRGGGGREERSIGIVSGLRQRVERLEAVGRREGEKRSRKEDHKWRGRGAFDSKVETRRGAATSKRGRQGVLKT